MDFVKHSKDLIIPNKILNMPKKVLFIILDGIADFGETTPLEQAFKPNLDILTKNGYAGLVENRLTKHPDSGVSTFVLLGYSKEDYPGRGYTEALGIGLRPTPGSVYLRANFATVKDVMEDKFKTGEYKPELIVVDRRAGRDSSGLFDISKDIKGFFFNGVKISFYKSLGYRGVVVLNSVNISPNISDSDPYVEGKEVLEVKSLSMDDKAGKTAAALNKFLKETHKILKNHPANKYRKLPVNYILLRGASSYKYVKSFKDSHGLDGACIGATPIIKGVCRSMEMEVPDISGALGDHKTNLGEKTLKALDLLNKKNFVILHIKSCDVFAHDKKPSMKRLFIEKVDREVFRRILEYADFEKIMVVVTSDHPTSSKTGEHLEGFMPFTIYTKGIEANKVEKFDEESCKLGPVVNIEDFMEEVMNFVR
jgi:2,3-bisphosphoglycerate-independent phosphoglycerate mutase